MAIWLGVYVTGLVLWLGGSVVWWECGLGMGMFFCMVRMFCAWNVFGDQWFCGNDLFD